MWWYTASALPRIRPQGRLGKVALARWPDSPHIGVNLIHPAFAVRRGSRPPLREWRVPNRDLLRQPRQFREGHLK